QQQQQDQNKQQQQKRQQEAKGQQQQQQRAQQQQQDQNKQQQQKQQQQAKGQQQQQQRAQQQQQDQNKQQQQKQQQQARGQQQQQQRAQQQQQDQKKQQQAQGRQQASQQGQRVQQAEQRGVWQQHRATNWQSQHRDWQQRGGYNGYRIPDDRYRGNFGPDHSFRVYSAPVEVYGGRPRFQYDGYWFSVVDPWPEYWSDDWYQNDDVYIDYSGDGYYLYNRRYPGVGISLSVFGQQGGLQIAWQNYRARNWRSQHRTWRQRGGYNGYRIPDDRFRGYFGPNHWFRIYSNPVEVYGGRPRFQYGGYWFSVVDPWPEYWPNNWYENDDMYIDYSGDGYYLYNRRYPRDRVAIRVYME
ncbi:MAG: hypothetical protein WB543_10165, partial [Candidatus Acidiferrum sp.]